MNELRAMANAQKRLLQEVKALQEEPNPALLSLGPASDEDLFEWKAVMRGVVGTAYEGELNKEGNREIGLADVMMSRWSVEARYQRPLAVPPCAAQGRVPDADLPSQCAFQDGRDLPRSAQDQMDTCVYYLEHADRCESVADECGTRLAAECRRGGTS